MFSFQFPHPYFSPYLFIELNLLYWLSNQSKIYSVFCLVEAGKASNFESGISCQDGWMDFSWINYQELMKNMSMHYKIIMMMIIITLFYFNCHEQRTGLNHTVCPF